MTSRDPEWEVELYRPPSRLAPLERPLSIGIFCLALLVRLAYLKQLAGSPLWDDLPVDLAYYRDWALRIAAGEWEGDEVFEQSPLYAYFLGAIFKLFGPGLTAPRLVQVAVGSATCVLIHRIGGMAFSPAAGLVAGLMGAVYGPLLFYDAMLMKEVLAVFLLTAAIWLLLKGAGSDRGLLAVSGLLLGLGALVRDNLILVAPFIALWLLLDPWVGTLRTGRGRAGEGIARVASFTAGVALAVAPVAARNYHVSGDLVPLTAGGGEVFYIGNNPAADGRYSPPPFVRPGAVVEHEDFRAEAARRLGRPAGSLSRREASDFWLRQGLAWIRANPGAWLGLMGRKLLIFWNHYELPDNHSYDHHRRLLPILELPLPTFGLLAPIAAAGIFLSGARWRSALPLFFAGAGYLGSVLLFFNFGRFRMPLVPLLLVFAGQGIVGTIEAVATRRWARAALATAVLGAALGVTRIDLEHDPLHLGQSRQQVARLLLRSGRTQEADVESSEAVRLLEAFFTRMGGSPPGQGHGVPAPGRPGRPDLGAGFYAVLGEAYRTRAEVLRALGRGDEADVWEGYAATASEDVEGLALQGRRLVEQGRFEEAAGSFRRALEAGGSSLDPRARLRIALRLAEAQHRSGLPREALETVEEAVRACPDAPAEDLAAAHFGRALVRRDLGDRAAMREHLRECLQLDPHHPRADWIRREIARTEGTAPNGAAPRPPDAP